MVSRQSLLWLAGFLGITTLVACIPKRGQTVFTVNDWRLANAVQAAAKSWADNGVLIAGKVIVNWNGKGVPIRFVPREKLTELCESSDRHGCVTYTSSGQDFEGLWVLEGLPDLRLQEVLMHEMMHVMIPAMPHLEDPKIGIMHSRANSTEITTDDLDHVCSYSECA